MSRFGVLLLLIELSLASWTATRAQARERSEFPFTIPAFRERVVAERVQLHIIVQGPPELTESLVAGDFEIEVGGKRIEGFELDNLCPSLPHQPPPLVSEQTALLPSPPAYYLLFFDALQLTPAGRERAFEVARQLVPELLAQGAWLHVVGNGVHLWEGRGWTRDSETLLRDLEVLRGDVRQWDAGPATEDRKTEELLLFAHREVDQCKWARVGRSGAPTRSRPAVGGRCRQLARRILDAAAELGREELERARRSFERLASVLLLFPESAVFRGVLYFGDTLRRHPGGHYFSALLADREVQAFMERELGVDLLAQLVWRAQRGDAAEAPGFNALLQLAAAVGVRVYAIEAQGLVWPAARVTDAQATLTELALETGGRTFLNGVETGRILEALSADRRCVYLVTFDPAGLSRDRPLRVRVRVRPREVRVQTQGLLVIPSPMGRVAARLVRAWLARQGASARPLEGGLLPLGYEGGRFAALLQARLDGPPPKGGDVELGAVLLGRSGILGSWARRVSVKGARLPVILEIETEVPAGEHELVVMAREQDSDEPAVVSSKVVLVEPPRRGLTAGPVTLLQPQGGVFVRETGTLRSGFIALGERESMDPSRPAAFVTLVCRGPKGPPRAMVARTLAGSREVAFAPIEVELLTDPCAQLRDVIPAGRLGPGEFRYRLQVLVEGKIQSEAERAFHVAPQGSLAESERVGGQ